MFEYFNGLVDQTFVDIGSLNPVQGSATRILKSQGWKGINVDADFHHVKQFFGMNFEDLNLNYAISA